jgi:hypothetical protein
MFRLIKQLSRIFLVYIHLYSSASIPTLASVYVMYIAVIYKKACSTLKLNFIR